MTERTTARMVSAGVPRCVVPGAGLPRSVDVDRSNNNLDVIRHDGELFLVWRTAPTHFASRRARLHVVASDDGGTTWRAEATIAPGRDLREPRFVSWRGRLFLYWFTAGTRPWKFEPDRIWVSERTRGTWSRPEAISPPDCVVWRVRPVGDQLLMTLYRGASVMYGSRDALVTVEVWASDDGLEWKPLDPSHPVVHEGGSETEFIELRDGRVLGVIRKEGPGGGWGSELAIGPDPAHWRFRSDPRKFDSPYLLLDDGRPLLIARRQPFFGGRYDLGLRIGPARLRTLLYQLVYWLTPKRASVFSIDPDALTAEWLIDLPSAGDTAFAAAVELEPGRHLVFNYSSPTRRWWWPWVIGQLRPTHIDAIELYITH
jgi:hypothetical protein